MCCRKTKRLVSERQTFLQANCLPSTFLLLQNVNSGGKSSVKKLSVGAENMSECFPLYSAVMGAAAHLTGSDRGSCLSQCSCGHVPSAVIPPRHSVTWPFACITAVHLLSEVQGSILSVSQGAASSQGFCFASNFGLCGFI